MKNKDIARSAEAHFVSGYNCAESVLLSIAEAFSINTDISKNASFFGGGVGSTHQELCGAISGAVLILGQLLGRNNPETNIDEHKKIVKNILDSFNNKFTTVNCAKLIEGLDDDSKKKKYTDLVKFTAELTYKELSEINSNY